MLELCQEMSTWISFLLHAIFTKNSKMNSNNIFINLTWICHSNGNFEHRDYHQLIFIYLFAFCTLQILVTAEGLEEKCPLNVLLSIRVIVEGTSVTTDISRMLLIHNYCQYFVHTKWHTFSATVFWWCMWRPFMFGVYCVFEDFMDEVWKLKVTSLTRDWSVYLTQGHKKWRHCSCDETPKPNFFRTFSSYCVWMHMNKLNVHFLVKTQVGMLHGDIPDV